jgi:BirA family biotin operon repressor/biotin-[acetyl-CoA-carboxylase] ligase
VVGRSQLLEFLSDGEAHSPAEIARAFADSEQVIAGQIAVLVRLGLTIEQLPGGLYCLQGKVQPLDTDKIRTHLSSERTALADHVRICDEVDSTNSYLLREVHCGRIQCGAVCLAEAQSGGRGRWGRSWVATPYVNIMLSIAWCMRQTRVPMDGLGLAMGVAIVRALNDYGVQGIGLKWPNDVIWNERKLAGVLVEAARCGREAVVVVGVGVNVEVTEDDGRQIEQPWVDLKTIGSSVLDRNKLVALLIERLAEALATFDRSGFAPFHEHWERMHVYQGRCVRLLVDGEACNGRALGVIADGALRLIADDGIARVFHAGEASLRPLP